MGCLTGIFAASLLLLWTYNGVDAACPDGWCRHKGYCYIAKNLNVSWIDAVDYCTALGGTLPSVTSEDVQIGMKAFLPNSPVVPGTFWLYATDLINDGDWVWMGTKQSFTYTDWYPGFPSLANDTDHCVGTSRLDAYQWRTAPCDEGRNLLCQKIGTSDQPRQESRYGHYLDRYGNSRHGTYYVIVEDTGEDTC